MDPEQRRAMIVAAALPLVVELGASVTTSRIARAAGVGEGTIFRVFPDKDTLLAACLDEVARPDQTVALLGEIPLDLPLAERLLEAAETVRAHFGRMGAVVAALAASGRDPRSIRPETAGGARGARPEAAFDASQRALARLFEPERHVLRFPPDKLADTYQRLLMASDRPGFPAPLTTEELVDLFLNGAIDQQADRQEEHEDRRGGAGE